LALVGGSLFVKFISEIVRDSGNLSTDYRKLSAQPNKKK
jgi:hypothetical protein